MTEYVGELVTDAESDRRERLYESSGESFYLFRLHARAVVDATVRGSAARYINHACNPNCRSAIVVVGNTAIQALRAARQLALGEQDDLLLLLDQPRTTTHALGAVAAAAAADAAAAGAAADAAAAAAAAKGSSRRTPAAAPRELRGTRARAAGNAPRSHARDAEHAAWADTLWDRGIRYGTGERSDARPEAPHADLEGPADRDPARGATAADAVGPPHVPGQSTPSSPQATTTAAPDLAPIERLLHGISGHIAIFAQRDIAPGEEITYDYMVRSRR